MKAWCKKPSCPIKKDLNSLFNEGEVDIALLYFSGHGTDLNDGKLVTPDFAGMDAGISMSEVLSMANKSKSKNKIIILACCFSGKFGENSITNSSESVLASGVTIITASNREEYSIEFTNSPDEIYKLRQPYDQKDNVKMFKDLQLFESVGLIEPVGEEHMYFAAMHSKACKLTPLSLHYWKLSKDKRI